MYFFFNDTATTEIYTLSLHDALPISSGSESFRSSRSSCATADRSCRSASALRSEEHTSELQSRLHLVCRLLLEKKKKPDGTRLGPTTPTIVCHRRFEGITQRHQRGAR